MRYGHEGQNVTDDAGAALGEEKKIAALLSNSLANKSLAKDSVPLSPELVIVTFRS